MDQNHKEAPKNADSSGIRRQTSMGTLIIWNISKAIEANPNIDLKSAIKATQERLNSNAGNALDAQSPEEQYLACALLAWQHLGHSEADKLYQFVEMKRKQIPEKTCAEKMNQSKSPTLSPGSFISYVDSKFSKGVGSSSYDSCSLMGPVVKLPVEQKIVMRMDSTPAHPAKKSQLPATTDNDLKDKIDAACCMESACMDKLTQLDKSVTELRLRAERLARREAERVELLERAEAAWKDLELGYQRRLLMAEEKEDDMAKNIKRLIEERNSYKNACVSLAQLLRERGEIAENERAKLTVIEKEVCENACMRLKVRDESAKLDAILSEQHCKAAQLDRDFQFREEQVRRKLQTMVSELESVRALTCEAERALHAELNALRQQVTKVSHQLLEQDAENLQIKEELDLLREEKLEMVDDLDGCKVLCDGKIQGKMDDLNKKREQLNELKEKVMECQCKLPVDASVEVKRTPSLAALCKCSPEDKFVDSCSCTSLRTTLLTNLLEDLFSGLQSELGGCTTQMPCQLLKCLEDRHNWDKSSIIKTNLRNYFAQLLMGELDIAIATSIEKYHAKWVGASCADAARILPDRGGPENEGWQERALERRAQKLACKLAEELFQERSEQLTAKAKEIVRTGPPPCECQPRPAVYPCLVKPPTISSAAPPIRSAAPPISSAAPPISSAAPPTKERTTTERPPSAPTPAYWRRTHQDVAQLKVQLEDLKKDSIKKEDLKIMEENIVKLVQRATEIENIAVEPPSKGKQKKEMSRKNNSIHKSVNTEQGFKHCISSKLTSIKKKQSDLIPKKTNKNFMLGLQIEKPARSYKKMGRSFAVNLCLCDSEKDKQNIKQDVENKRILSRIATRNTLPQVLSLKQTKPISSHVASLETNNGKRSKISSRLPCPSNSVCFHKPPSNTSIDKLLETLAKWKCDLCNLDEKCREKCDANFNTDSMPDVKKEREPEKVFRNVSTKFSTSEQATPFKSSIIVANIPKCNEFQGEMPATESEYMGTINLDKSNEHVCRCTSGFKNKQEPNNEPKSAIFKCINSEACACRKSEMKNLEKQNIIDSNVETKKKNEDIPDSIPKIESNIQAESKLESDINHSVKTSTLLPSECEYCIKFLGVTLTNANSNKVSAEKDIDPKKEKNTPNKSKKRRINNPEVWYNNIDNSTRDPSHVHLPACVCDVKIDEVKDLLNNVVTKQHGDFCKNQDKSLDTQSFNNVIDNESCVCCNKAKKDESKDLELNAFHLLEEHLRDKLEEFKSANCKSSCIPPEEEEKIFSTILQRVKKIITESTIDTACRCASEEPAEGSWHRAYMLLQEYLKIKIKRVQCLCLPTEDAKETVLPNVMEKVYNLIDTDFQRLKQICKCQNNSKAHDPNLNIEIPEKDSCHAHEIDTNTSTDFQNIEKMSKEVSNRSLVVTENISSQISPNIEMETKSCDIMEMSYLNTETGTTNKCCRITKLNHDKCYCLNSTRITKSNVELVGTEVFVSQCINVQEGVEVSFPKKIQDSDPQQKSNTVLDSILEDKPDNRKSTPYIGYTVDCSCDSVLGPCICTKSMISGKNDNINSIWNTLTSNKLRYNDISYIMDAVPNKESTEANDLTKTYNATSPQAVDKVTCDTKVSAQYCEELILKDSKKKLNKTFVSTTESGNDVRYARGSNSGGPMEWHECSSTKQNTQKHNDISHNICDDSFYSPERVLRGTNEGLIKSDQIESLSSNCECNMVPMCHVKMLVENIENKLIHSKCTCDSMSSKICPVHSKIH